MLKRIEYSLREVSHNHLVIDFISYRGYLGFIEIWNKSNVIYTDNIINGLDIKRSREVLKITNRLIILNKLGLLKHR